MSKKRFAVYSVLFTIGLTIAAYSFYQLDFKFANIPAVAYGDLQKGSDEFESHEIKMIEGDFSASLVTIKEHETDETKVVVNYEHYKNIQYDAKIENEILKIRISQKFLWWNAFSFGTDAGDIEIFVPKNMTFDYNLDASAGKITMTDITSNRVDVELSAGEVKINNCQIDTANISVSAGDVHVNDSRVRHLTADVSAGGVFGSNLDCDKINFEVSAGTIKLHLMGKKSDYNIDVRVSAGSCNVSDQYDSSLTKYIKGEVSAGEAKFTFTN